MRDFRGSIRSEHNLYIECEHRLALEESLQVARMKTYNHNCWRWRTSIPRSLPSLRIVVCVP